MATATTLTPAQQYAKYAEKVLYALEIGLDKGEIDPVDVTALLIEFEQHSDLDSLKIKVDQLVAMYPALSEVIYQEKVETAENFDEMVQKYITYLIQNGRASEVTAVTTQANTIDKSIEKLKALFPEVNNL